MDKLDLKAINCTKINHYVCSRFSEKRYVFKWIFENFSQSENLLYKSECFSFPYVRNTFTVKKCLKNNCIDAVQVDIDSTSDIKCEVYFSNQEGKVIKPPNTGSDSRNAKFKYCYGFCLEQEILKRENYLKNDCLTVIGVIKSKEIIIREYYSYCPRFKSPSDYLEVLASDLNGLDAQILNEKIQILINGEPMQASRCILCCRSAIIEHKYNIAKDSVKDLPVIINIDDVPYAIFTRVVSFLCTGTVHDENFQELCELYDAANKYGICELRDACGDLLWSKLTIQDACRILILSDRHDDYYLKSSLLAYFKFHFENIIWTSGWQNMMFENPLLAMEVIKMDTEEQNQKKVKRSLAIILANRKKH